MHATQFLPHPAVAEKIRNVLRSCQCTVTSGDYARRLVKTIAAVTHSEHAIWLNWPAGHKSVVAETEGFPCSGRMHALRDCASRLSNDLSPTDGIQSIAVAPILFRSSITGVLAVVNGAVPYTPADLDFLSDVGAAAVLEFETLERAGVLGLATPRQRTFDLIHGLRQPLGVLEACAFYLEMVLPAGEHRAREQVAEMQRQLDRASGILDESAQLYPPCTSGKGFAETEPAEEPSRILTNSAMSMVT